MTDHGATNKRAPCMPSLPVKAWRKARVAWWGSASALRGWRARARRSAAAAGESAPPFDLLAYNPIGCRNTGGDQVAALGPLALLPPGTKAHCVVGRGNLRRLRRIRHLEDTGAFHADVVARARDLARLAARGVVVHLADGDQRLAPLLGNHLFGLMTADVCADVDARERLGIAMRRAALRQHSTWGRARRCAGDLPLVSILLATKRPAFLPWALANVARQTYPAVELVLALHGDGFAGVERHLAQLPQPAKVLRLAARDTQGAVLSAATEAAAGTLLAKMDDDEVYGDDHLWDLVLAREYSQAQLVGKWLEYIYLAAADRTIRWRNGASERYWPSSLAGSALLISQQDLRRSGGWRNAPASVDVKLAQDVVRNGGSVYRTHSSGFLVVRHGHGHTWNDRHGAEDVLLAKADCVRRGFQPGWAGVAPLEIAYPAFGPAFGPAFNPAFNMGAADTATTGG